MADATITLSGTIQHESSELPTLPGQPGCRRVVQIAAASELRPVIALCDDSSIWAYDKSTGWFRIPEVPVEG